MIVEFYQNYFNINVGKRKIENFSLQLISLVWHSKGLRKPSTIYMFTYCPYFHPLLINAQVNKFVHEVHGTSIKK